MKTLNWLSWATGIIATASIFCGSVNFLFGTHLFGVNHAVNYFHVANSFLLLTICLLVYINLSNCECGKEHN